MIKHKLLSLFVALIATTNLFASDIQVDGIWYDFDETKLTASVTYRGSVSYLYSEYTGSVVIPATVSYNSKTYSVTTIGVDAFHGCTALTSVTIPNSVTTIGQSAFYGCNGLTSITIPNSVTTIGQSAFYGCNGLTSITIPNSVTTIGQSAFSGCNGLISITIPNSVTTIGDYAFNNVNNIVYNGTATGSPWEAKCVNGYVDGYLVYRDAIKTTLCGCSSIATGAVTIPNSVTTIGEDAFNGCSGLTSITIPNSVTTIGEDAFRGCIGLTSVTIPNSVTTIGEDAFEGCSGLTSPIYNTTIFARLPTSYTGAYTIPDGIKQIAKYAFNWCKSLTSITIPNSVTTIGEYAFNGCSGLTKTNYAGTIADWCKIKFIENNSNPMSYSHNFYINDVEVKDWVIPEGVDTIGNYAFVRCYSLTSVTIPNSVTTIGEYAFYVCTGLTSINVDAANAHYCSVDGVLFNYAKDTLILYPMGNTRTTYTIPNSVTTIGDHAFKNCSGLTSVTIPNSVTTIGDWAFSDCSGLASITIGNSVTTIGYYAFYYCTALTSVTIGNSVRVIGERAFEYCSGLTKTNYTGTIADWCKISFAGSYNGCFSNPIHYSHNFFIYNVEVKDLVIPEGVKSIGYHAFDCCSGLTSVTIPKSITSIGSEAFYSCTNLKTVTNFSPLVFHKGSTEYGYVAYYADVVYNYTRLGDFILTSDNTLIEYVGKGGNISIPSGVSSIDAYVFANNSTITSVTIPATIRAIGNSAFKDCYNIRSITCYVQVPPSLGTNVFNGLSQYAKVYVLKSSLEDYQFALGWRDLNLFPIGAEEHPIVSDQVSVMPSTDNVILTWPANDNAAEYKLEITKDGVVFCTLKFNAQGQLTGIAFAPSRSGEQRTMQAAEMAANGWQFTVTGLTPGSKYVYTVDVINAQQQSIKQYTGEFYTDGYTDLKGLTIDNAQCTVRKFIKDNQLYIFRGDKIYNAAGQKVK